MEILTVIVTLCLDQERHLVTTIMEITKEFLSSASSFRPFFLLKYIWDAVGLNSNEEDVEGPVAYVDRKIVVDTYSMDDNHYTSFLEDYYQFCRFYARFYNVLITYINSYQIMINQCYH
jgi:hypothetical protein